MVRRSLPSHLAVFREATRSFPIGSWPLKRGVAKRLNGLVCTCVLGCNFGQPDARTNGSCKIRRIPPARRGDLELCLYTNRIKSLLLRALLSMQYVPHLSLRPAKTDLAEEAHRSFSLLDRTLQSPAPQLLSFSASQALCWQAGPRRAASRSPDSSCPVRTGHFSCVLRKATVSAVTPRFRPQSGPVGTKRPTVCRGCADLIACKYDGCTRPGSLSVLSASCSLALVVLLGCVLRNQLGPRETGLEDEPILPQCQMICPCLNIRITL